MSDEHLSFDELAELAEGLLSRRRAQTAQEHLEECDDCRNKADAIEAVPDALRSLGAVTMPADVAARLDRVLATAGSASAGETVVPDLGAVRRRRQTPPRWIYGAAAAVVVIGAASAVLATRGGHHPSESAGSAIVPTPLVATNLAPAFVQEESGQVYTPGTLGALAPSLVSGGLGTPAGGGAEAPIQPAPNGKSANTGSGQSATTSVAPGIAAPPNAVPSTETHSQEQFSVVLVPRSLQRYSSSRPALLQCAAFITDTANAAPLAVDFARWSDPATHSRRVPALVMVFQDPQDASELDVYVVAPACNDSSLLDLRVVAKS